MDLSAVRARRKKTLFRPWNSYLAKKGVVDATACARSLDVARERAAEGLAPHFAPLARLTAGLLDTYEGINAAYYERRGLSAPGAADDAAAQAERELVAVLSQHSQTDQQRQPLQSSSQVQHGSGAPSSSSAGSASNVVATGSSGSGSVSSKKIKGKKETSPMSVQYCDENFDYIVRTGETFNNRYMLEKVIGRGSFGQVVRAYDSRDNTHVAIKIIKNNSLYVEQALSEVRMTSYLNRIDPEDAHSIMRLRDKFIFRGHQCLVLELLSFSLYDLLRSTEFYGVSLNLVRKFCKQILRCLAFLARSDVNIAHCDLKPENVLLRHPQRSAIKVVDFGASCRISESMFTYVQSRFYRAPEVILGLPYATQVDVWSLGCMLIELHTGYPVFAGKDEAHQMTIIVERLGLPPKHMLEDGKKTGMFFDRDPVTGEWEMKASASSNKEKVIPNSKPIDAFVDYHTGATNGRRKRVSGGHSEEDYEIFLALAGKMLKYDPKQRITAEEALLDPFVRGSCTSRSGRDSPPPIPAMGTVGDNVVTELDPGRKAPVQRMRKGVEIANIVKIHADASFGDLSDVGEVSADMGGKLRLSKSEPAFEPLPKRTFIFKTSDWAEEVGIEPPPWRAGGNTGGGNEDDNTGAVGPSRERRDMRRNLPAAGGGQRLERRRHRIRPDTNDAAQRWGVMTGASSLPLGLSEFAAEGAGRQLARRRPFHSALPRGHGNALWLYVRAYEKD